jgi:rhodanese-related sulfurtransferase
MTRKLAGVIMALFVLGVSAAAAPTIHVDSETYDFGSIVEGYAIEHTFVLSNIGDETLTITKVVPKCGCTTTGFVTPAELKPGESADLHATVSSNGYGGLTMSKVIYVYSNDPQYPEGRGEKLILYVTGAVSRNVPYHKPVEDLYLYSILLVDLRTEAEFASGHLLGAFNILPDNLNETLGAVSVPSGTVIVLYDATGALADSVVDGFVAAGFPLARALTGGLARWTRGYGTRYLFPEPVDADYGEATAGTTRYTYEPVLFNDAFYVLIDLREPEAYAAGHLAGATNIPSSEFGVARLDDRLGDLPSDAKIIVYDQTGARGDTAAQILIGAGYVNAKSLLGGLDEWQRVYGDQLIWTDTR